MSSWDGAYSVSLAAVAMFNPEPAVSFTHLEAIMRAVLEGEASAHLLVASRV